MDRPNILFVMTDQHRGDCIGADPDCPRDSDGYPIVHTPNIDSFVAVGALFSRAYTPAPSCIPARQCLLTGQTPATNEATGWVTTPWEFEHPLPAELSAAGYQTKLAGKLHAIPPDNHLGFEDVDRHDALYGQSDDYSEWLAAQSDGRVDELSHGLGRNSWDPRPSHLPEQQHPTVWTTDRALAFLNERDESRPFFLNVSYVRPHTPLDPPQVYWDMYADRELPDPYRGDWVADMYGEKCPEYPSTSAWVADLPPHIVHRARAGYYGLITQIDHQLKRLLDELRVQGELANTFILVCSDHGEMLGDHTLWRKTYGYEGSARVPMVMQFPEAFDGPRGQIIDQPVGLEDVLPTLLEIAGAEVPDSVEGRNLLDLVARPDRLDWRDWYHGEHAAGTYDQENGTQYVVGERWKFIWNSVTGDELLFDLESDPGETRNLATDVESDAEYAAAREALIDRLADRSEGFLSDGELSTIPPDADPEAVGDQNDCS